MKRTGKNTGDIKARPHRRGRELHAGWSPLRVIMERLVDGIIIVDTNGIVRFVNPAATALFGRKAEDFVGQAFGFPAVADETVDLDILGRGGKTAVVEMRVTETKWDGKKAYLASLRDVTDRKRAETELKKKTEELREMTRQLWQAAKLATMGELTASIAHELNNPLATVSLRTESLLARTQADSPNQRELKIVEQEVERMGVLVANLLQFSRRGQQQISTVDVCEEIEKTMELVYYHLRKHNIIIQREFAKDVPHIHADRQQLRQLFLNLFTNASDAMPHGGTLTIRITAPPESRRIIVEVADTGTGIPPEILPRVIEPFYTTKPEGKGTGLGLAICRRIVEEHNGTFDLTSEGIPGKGTTARISLPVINGTNAAGLKNQQPGETQGAKDDTEKFEPQGGPTGHR